MSITYKKSWVLCLSGANNALARVNAALETNEPDAKVLQPLIEALWWVRAADESLSTEFKPPTRPKGQPAAVHPWDDVLRANMSCVGFLDGIRWARNRITHQICHWEMAESPFHWEDAEVLAPTCTVEKHHDYGRQQYKDFLEGKDARHALRIAIDGIKSEAMGKLPP
jgi:hypothetical protein